MAKLMSDLRYTPPSRGGRYKQRSAGNDKEATRKEQTEINYLEKTRQQQEAVSNQYEGKLEGVFTSEATNRLELKQLKNTLDDAEQKNKKIKNDREVKRLQDLAIQQEEKAEWLGKFSPILGETIFKTAKGTWDWAAARRDRGEIDNFKFEVKHEEYDKALNTLVGDSQNDQFQNQVGGDIPAAKKLAKNVEEQRTKYLWSDKYTLRQADVIKQNWAIIVSEALGDKPLDQQTGELIETRLQQVKKDLGIGKGSAGDRAVNEFAQKKINAWGAYRNQQAKVSNSEREIDQLWQDWLIIKKDYDSSSPEDQKKLSLAFNDLCLAYNSRYEFSKDGKFITPADRGINFGQACDAAVMDAMQKHIDKFDDWNDFKNLLKGHTLPEKKHKGKPYGTYVNDLPSWIYRRKNKEGEWKDAFTEAKQNRIKKGKKQDEVELQESNAKLTDRLINPDNPEYLDPTDYSKGGGRDSIMSLYGRLTHPDQKKIISSLYNATPDSTSDIIVWSNLDKAWKDKDFVEFSRNYYLLKTDKERKALNGKFKQLTELNSVGMTPQKQLDKATNLVSEWVGYQMLSGVTVPEGISSAAEDARQLFAFAYENQDPVKYENDVKGRVKAAWTEVRDAIRDENGRYQKIEPSDDETGAGLRMQLVNFDSINLKEDVMSRKDIKNRLNENQNWKTIVAPEKGAKFMSNEDFTTMMDSIITGKDTIYVPENVRTLVKEIPQDPENPVFAEDALNFIIEQHQKATGDKVWNYAKIKPGPRQLLHTLLKDTPGYNNFALTMKDTDIQMVHAAIEYKHRFGSPYMPNNLKTYSKETGDQGVLKSFIAETGVNISYDNTGALQSSDPEKLIKMGQSLGIKYNPWENKFIYNRY